MKSYLVGMQTHTVDWCIDLENSLTLQVSWPRKGAAMQMFVDDRYDQL